MIMNRLKIFFITSFLAIIAGYCYTQTTGTKLFFAIDGLAPALKAGIKKDLSDRFSIQASAGFCLVGPSLLSYNCFGSYIITKPEKPFGVFTYFGFPDNYIDVISPMFSLGPGGGAGIRYRFKNSSTLSLRMGIISGPSVDNKEFLWLTLPNFGIECAFRLRKNKGKD